MTQNIQQCEQVVKNPTVLSRDGDSVGQCKSMLVPALGDYLASLVERGCFFREGYVKRFCNAEVATPADVAIEFRAFFNPPADVEISVLP